MSREPGGSASACVSVPCFWLWLCLPLVRRTAPRWAVFELGNPSPKTRATRLVLTLVSLGVFDAQKPLQG